MPKFLLNNRLIYSARPRGKFFFPLFFCCLSLNAFCIVVEDFKTAFANANAFTVNLPTQSDFQVALKKQNKEKIFGWSYRAAMHVIGSESDKDIQKWIYLRDASVELLKDEDSSPWETYARSEIFLVWGLAKMRAGSRISGANDIRQSWNLTEKLLQKWPAFLPAKKNHALLKTLVGLVPDKYRKLVEVFGFKGSLKEGLSDLASLSRKTLSGDFFFIHEQVNFLWLVILRNYGTESQINQALETMNTHKFSGGPLSQYAMASSLISVGRRTEASHILFNNQSIPSVVFPWLLWLKANFLLQELNPDAEKYFLQYIKHNSSASYVRASFLRLSWLYQCLGDTARSAGFKANVLRMGKDQIDEDAEATKEVETKLRQETCLLRARLRFDGADYSGALKEISQCSPTSFPSLRYVEEYHYRLGRIYMKLGEQAKAIQMFVRCLSGPGQTSAYFKANSALMMGLLMEQNGRITEAGTFFTKAIDFKDHEYERSIEMKAREGLRRLSQRP